MKRRFLRLLERAGLIGPAFRTYERIVSLRPGRPAAVDGPPLPPRRLMVRVAGTADADWFLRSGRAAYDAIAAHVPLAEIDSVLDFGCGCGRVTRYWDDFAGTVSGSDVSAKAVDWCRANLPFAPLRGQRLEPPLAFADESFDLVYALSVFTHLTAELQLAWRDELRRVLRPGGRLLVTTHGRSYRAPPRRRRAGALRARRARRPLGRRPGHEPLQRLSPGAAICARRSRKGSRFVELEPEGSARQPDAGPRPAQRVAA